MQNCGDMYFFSLVDTINNGIARLFVLDWMKYEEVIISFYIYT